MFDLDAQRRGWRDALLGEDALGPIEVDELEDQLLSELETLTPLGLSEEEAFWVAAKRVGDHSALATEFGKVNRKAVWNKRIQWMLAGYLVAIVLSTFVSAVSNGAALLVASLSRSASLTASVYMGANILLVILILFLVTVSTRQEFSQNRVQRLLERARQNIVLSAVVVTIAVLFLRFLGVLSYNNLASALTYELTRGVEASNYGPFLVYTDYFRLLVWVLLPPAVIVAIWRLQRARNKVGPSSSPQKSL